MDRVATGRLAVHPDRRVSTSSGTSWRSTTPGDPIYPEMHHSAFNEGIPIARIVERLKSKGLSDGLTLV